MARTSNKSAKASTPRSRKRLDRVGRESRGSQRDRLVSAMIEVAAEAGSQAAGIGQVSARAGVSRATFYKQFTGKEDCLVAAQRTAARRLFSEMDERFGEGDWSDSGRQVLTHVAEALCRDPNSARLIIVESLGGGAELRDERKHLMDTYARLTQVFLENTADGGMIVDIPPIAVMGALRHIVSRYLRVHADDHLPGLADPIIKWLHGYSVPAALGRWSISPYAALQQTPPRTPRAREPVNTKLPPGRHGLSPAVVARSRRTRIIHGMATAAMAKGYVNTTVADIVAEAKVARDVFYEHFRGKEHAFLEAQDYPTQYIVDRCVAAYFSVAPWPERVWRCLHTLLELIRDNLAISHLRLVEAYAAGPIAIKRAEDITRSFTTFLEEGYHYRTDAEKPPRLCGQLAAGAIFEIVQRQAARGEIDSLVEQLPLLTYIALAPFTGAERARELVEELNAEAPDAVA